MTKVKFYTYDIFDNMDKIKRIRYFNTCHKQALNCGLICKCNFKDRFPKLEMWGTKQQFFKYYIRTLTKCKYKLNGAKRCMSVLFWE